MAKILRIAEIEERTGFCRRTIYNLVERGEFPRQVQLTRRSVGWLESDYDAWLAERIAARDGEKAA